MRHDPRPFKFSAHHYAMVHEGDPDSPWQEEVGLTDEEEERMAADIAEQENLEQHMGFIIDPDKWPLWPILPVKRGGFTDGQQGIIVSEKIDGLLAQFRVYETSLFEMDFQKCPKHDYETVEALVHDGWRVD